jgi:putative transposase
LCASCAARTSWPQQARLARRSPPSWRCRRATLYNWRRTYGGMDTDAAKELKELREQNARLKRLLAEAELEKDALREVAKGKF